jgi:broad specificity phosphatase PhoE
VNRKRPKKKPMSQVLTYRNKIKLAAGPNVILCRHGDTDMNDQGDENAHRIRGWANVPLNEDGHEQAKELGRKLGHLPIKHVYCSDLGRAIDTGRQIAKAARCEMTPDHDLRPWHVGQLTGKPVKDAIPKIVRYTKNEDDPIPDGESFRKYRLRFLGELDRIMDLAKKHDATFCVVTHSRGMQCAQAWLAKGCPSDLTISVPRMNEYSSELATGSALQLRPNGDRWVASLLADTKGESQKATS